jgi:hypothetical protein
MATFSAALVAFLFRKNKHSITLAASRIIQMAWHSGVTMFFSYPYIAKRRRHQSARKPAPRLGFDFLMNAP